MIKTTVKEQKKGSKLAINSNEVQKWEGDIEIKMGRVICTEEKYQMNGSAKI